MPAFIAHLLLAKDLADTQGIKEVVKNKNYFLLGSLGPDLPYYRNVYGSAIGTFFEEKFNPDSPGFYGFGDFFHARIPNLFPMKLIEVIKKDNCPATQEEKISFVLGYLTHMAADQHIHPFVEKNSGPYFVSGRFRKEHRQLEVYQDLLLLETKYPKDEFLKINLGEWIEVGRVLKEASVAPEFSDPTRESINERKIYTEEWFQSFIQRGFLEAYSLLIEGGEVEAWVRGFDSVLGVYKKIGPYRSGFEELKKNSKEAEKYRTLFEDYVNLYFEPAKVLASGYIKAAVEFLRSGSITERERKKFTEKVPDIDLNSPLTKV